MINMNFEIKKLIETNYIKKGWFDNDILNILLKDVDKKIIKCIDNSVRPSAVRQEEKIKTIFKPFSLFPIEETSFIVMQQAPYPNEEHMNGLLFLPGANGKNTNDILSNIYTISAQYGNKTMFEVWNKNIEKCVTDNKILFLNTSLTFESMDAANQHKEAWKPFIDKILSNVINLKNQSGTTSSFLWVKNQKNILVQKIA